MTTPSPLVDGFKEALSCWASGVCVVTTNASGLLYGLTVSSFSALSLHPPLVLICINNQNRMAELVVQSKGFGISILSADQEPASRYFARPGRVPTPDFTEIDGEWTPSGQPIVKNAMAWLTCELHRTVVEGDHTIVVGKVLQTHAEADRSPLIYFRRGYRTVSG